MTTTITTVVEFEYDENGRIKKETKTVTESQQPPAQINPHVWTYPSGGRIHPATAYTATYLNDVDLQPR